MTYKVLLTEQDKPIHIELEHEPYDGVVFRFTSIQMRPVNEEMRLRFCYEILEDPLDKTKEMSQSETISFEKHIADVLLELVLTTNAHRDHSSSEPDSE